MLTAFGVSVVAIACIPWFVAHVGLGPWRRRAELLPTPAAPADLLVVVPARDEAPVIGRCVQALRRIPGDRLRIVVVDDHSADDTAVRAADAAAGDPRVHIHSAPARPPGWSGKSAAMWAAHPGSEPWILFVDADVVVDRRLPTALITLASNEGFDLVSAFGRWETPTWGTRLLVPAFGWLIRGLVDPRRVEDGRAPFANGQMVLARRSVYEAVGGHSSVASEVLDDVALARHVAGSGGRVAVRWAPWGFSVRAYDTVQDVIGGYRKNLAAGLGARTGSVALAIVAVLWVYAAPPLVLIAGLACWNPWWVTGGAGALVLMVALRVRLDVLDGRPAGLAWLQPVAGLMIAWTLFRSGFGPPVLWKGRRFRRGHPID